ncbi:hypothetical protein FLX56_04140 [Synechococcus moorigangaii CMS01]|nr:hypothetical protein [Synechococcus moorigangaii CMS01]
MPPAPQKQLPRLITFQHLVKTHHGRAYFLGGSGLAMALASSLAFATLINPRIPLPILDPLLGEQPRRTAALFLQESVTSPQPSTTVVTPNGTPGLVSPSSPQNPTPVLPFWVYGLILSSSLLGSSLFTYALYRLYYQSRRRPKVPKSLGRSPLSVSPPQDS